ncbi:MAG: RdgB/HAM1 family non-canonical purine NTP pyrophosphatase [Actinomycetota bacterium]|nr:RdgB/HAM1 family non-canonical purine NTP pyrophosphatase [Actinomycetota bacterium]
MKRQSVKSPHGVVVASKNVDKIAEIEAVLAALDPPIAVIPGHVWDDIDETEDTLGGNALLKARAVAAATGHAAVADDTGLEVEALGGEPGVNTARYAGEDATYEENVTKLLAELEGVTERAARFRTAVALVSPTGEELVVEGALEGVITTERRGSDGFGYDPIFEVDGRTLAEIPLAEKNRISHRALALAALAEALTD